MIFDLRTYTLRTGTVRAFLKQYEEEGYAIQCEHLGEPIAWFTTEVGDLNEIVHLWKYADMADREARRAALEQDPRWNAYRSRAGDVVLAQRNSILRSAPFSPL